MGLNRQHLDYSPNVFPAELRLEICELDLNFFINTVQRQLATMLHVTASCMHNNFI